MDNNKVRKVNTIFEYNEYLGMKTHHPLVAIIDLSKSKLIRHELQMLGFYTVFLKDVECGNLVYGRQTYDYQKGTVVCIAPGQIVGCADTGELFQPKGWALCFHPDLIHGTSLGKHMREYSYFSYESREALHLSESERDIFIDCLEKIQQEVSHPVDRMSKRLIAKNIELLLDYCLRFYERQFITRENVNRDILTRFEQLLDEYFAGNNAERNGLPTVKHCAEKLCLSANYFGDLIKKETGHTAQEYIQGKIVDLGKELILDPATNISQVAYRLGFQYPQHFTRMFKRATGLTPNEYRLRAK